MFPCLFFEILAVKNVPFPAAGWHMARKRHDFSADSFVDVIFLLEEFVQDPLGLCQRKPLVGEIGEIFLPQAVDDKMRQV